MPSLEALEEALPKAIAGCGSLFSDPRVTQLKFMATDASAKASKKTEKAEKASAKAKEGK
jgi:hypothetical protein